MCHSKLLIRERCGCEHDVVRKFMVHIHAISIGEVRDILSTKVLSTMAYSEPFLRRNAALGRVSPKFPELKGGSGMWPFVTFRKVELDENNTAGGIRRGADQLAVTKP